jgi:hypothetical protein
MPVVCWLYNSLTRSSTSWMQHQHYLGHLISTQAGKYLASGKRKRYHALPLSVVQAAAAELQPLLEAAQAHLDSRQPGNTINENDTSWISPDQQQIATRVSSNLAGLSTAPLACLSSSDQQDILLRTFKAGKLRSFGSSVSPSDWHPMQSAHSGCCVLLPQQAGGWHGRQGGGQPCQ